MPAPDHQLEVLRIYQRLVDLRDDWAGAIVLCCGPDCALSGIPAAASIAGAATLAIDPDTAATKQALRRGELDFVVNTLDEALRTLKNQVRQRRPLGVGLLADIDATLTEMVERGVQPNVRLMTRATPNYAGLKALEERGMNYFCASTQDELDRRMLILNGKRHYECFFAAENPSALRGLDARLLAALPTEDTVRRRWLQCISHYPRPALADGRWTWLSDNEVDRLAALGITSRSR